MTPTVALATCAELPELDEEGRDLLAALADRGAAARAAVWDDPSEQWNDYDLVVIRATWDYAPRRAEFLAWAGSVPLLANAADVVAWNTDKRYLRQLADADLAVVPTVWLAPGDPVRLPDAGEYVVKPAVSAGARDTARYQPEDADHALAHIEQLHADARLVMVQPYVASVDVVGETALLYLGGRYSHCVGKAALLTNRDWTVDGLYREETITVREPRREELALAERVLAAVPGGADDLLYARVDLLADSTGRPMLLELELTEPSMFLPYAPGSVDRFADAIMARVGAAARR